MDIRRDLLLGARGWEHPSWKAAFYPDDLPAEWQLSYYSNEFQTAMVPSSRWMGAGPEELRQWQEEVPQGFRFYFEVDDSGQVGAWLARWGESLCDVLASLPSALVVPDAVAAASIEAACPAIPVYRPGHSRADVGEMFVRDSLAEAGTGELFCVGGRDMPDLRRLRAVVEALVSQPGRDQEPAALIYTGDEVPVKNLEEARTLLQLLGIA